LLSRGYLPKPRLSFRRLWVAHDTSDDRTVLVTKSHIEIILVPMTRRAALACRYENKVGVFDLRMNHRDATIRFAQAAYPGRAAKVELNFV